MEGGGWAERYERARSLAARGRTREALAPLERATQLNRRLGRAWRLLGDIRLVAGEVREAQRAYDRMLAAVIPRADLRPAADALAEGRLREAEQTLRAFLSARPRAPGSIVAAHLLAEALARKGDLGAAEALLAHCLADSPGLSLARQSYALLLLRTGRPGAALDELDRVLAEDTANHRCRMARAAALTALGDHAAAVDATAALMEDFPDQPHGWLVLGHGLRTLGRTEAAIAAYRRCLELDPACAEARWSLANLATWRASPAERAATEAELQRPGLGRRERSLLLFSLAKALEDEGRTAEAFAAYAEANALQRDSRGHDPEALSALVRRSKGLFTPAFFEARSGFGANSDAPIFVVGLPRSGSSLIEQILASHSAVEGLGELAQLQEIADALIAESSGSDWPGPLAGLTGPRAAGLGEAYLEGVRPLRRLGRPRFVDKAPWNFSSVGLIALILPSARIVDVRRHPLACCLSVFKQHFGGGFGFAYDLGRLGRYYADYVELMAHFDEALPGRVVRVYYEALVGDPEGEARRLLEELDLPYDPAVLRFFENDRPVATPSAEQVRRPIFADAVDGWRAYEPWLGPLKQALGPTLAAYPFA